MKAEPVQLTSVMPAVFCGCTRSIRRRLQKSVFFCHPPGCGFQSSRTPSLRISTDSRKSVPSLCVNRYAAGEAGTAREMGSASSSRWRGHLVRGKATFQVSERGSCSGAQPTEGTLPLSHYYLLFIIATLQCSGSGGPTAFRGLHNSGIRGNKQVLFLVLNALWPGNPKLRPSGNVPSQLHPSMARPSRAPPARCSPDKAPNPIVQSFAPPGGSSITRRLLTAPPSRDCHSFRPSDPPTAP